MTDAAQRIDDYIAKARPFARPILERIRNAVEQHCPQAGPAIKWGIPAWSYKGKLLCSMAAFKEHATFGFWHGDLVTGTKGLGAMGSFGRLTEVEQLPDDAAMRTMLARATELIDQGVKPPHVEGRGKHPRPEVTMHPRFQSALNAHSEARRQFEAFSPSQQREYLEWIAEAKRDETREKRVAQAVDWLAQGKKRNWKYENC